MFIGTYNGLSDSTYFLVKELYENGALVSSRYGLTKELTDVHILLKNPKDRFLVLDKRGNNLFHTVAETLWVLSGSNDIQFLQPFLPRAKEFSDDGKTWRAGYGRRLRKHFGGIDQLAEVFGLLKKDLYTRRAYFVIPDPEHDLTASTVDHPCTSVVNFLVRNDDSGAPRLNVYCSMRSNDILWGYSSINMFEWTFIQELFANLLGIEVGTYTHNAVSLHLYENHFDRARSIIESDVNKTRFSQEYSFVSLENNVIVRDFIQLDEILEDYLNCVKNVWEGGDSEPGEFGSPFSDYVNFCVAYLYLKRDRVSIEKAVNILNRISVSSFLYSHLNNYINSKINEQVPSITEG
jgi:thymidylate synthase